jgi:hypothetical protein
MTLSIHDSQHKWHSITTLYHYAKCHAVFVSMPSGIGVNVVMLSFLALPKNVFLNYVC